MSTNIFENLEEKFETTVDLTVDDIIEAGKRRSSFPRTSDQITYGRAGSFLENLTLRELSFYLVHVKSEHEDDDEGNISEKADELRKKFLSVEWDIQDLVEELIKERL